jgi:uncharacterized repeat protein (TIGR01451 family)
MRRLWSILLLALAAWALAQDNPVAFRIESFIVDVITTEGGARQENFVPATTARRGQVVEYRIFVTNRGTTTLPAGTVVITGPIPQGTVYLDLSATPTSERLLTEFTADGGSTFMEAPVLVTAADGTRRVADPSEYTAIRWTLLFALEPGQEEVLLYRVTVQ